MGPQLGALLGAPKLGYQYTLAGTVLAPDVQLLNQESLENTSCKPLFSLGFMVDGGVVLCAVVTPVICPLVSVCSKFLLNLPVAKPLESSLRSQFLGLRGMRVELFIPTTVELSDCSGDGGCFRPIPCGLFLSGTVSFVIKDSAAVSASAADDTT